MTAKAKWTVLTYIAAHNNLDQFGKKSLMEILGVGSTADVIHGALYDGKIGAGRYVMGDPGLVDSQEQLGSFDSGDPDGLIATAKWLFEKYPADRYGVILWSHGTGWEPDELEEIANEVRPGAQTGETELQERAGAPGSQVLFRSSLRAMLKPDKRTERAILFDDGTGHSLDTLELARVVRTIAGTVGQPLEFLGMDACLMANIEVAYEIRDAVRFLSASEELVPAHSWPYATIFSELKTSPDMSGADLARHVVNHYVNFYTANPPSAGEVTMVAVDLGHLQDLVEGFSRLATLLRKGMNSEADRFWKAQWTTRMKEARLRDDSEVETMCEPGKNTNTKFCHHLWDIRTLARHLSTSDASPEIRQAAHDLDQALEQGKGAVLAERHRGDWHDGIGGLTVYCAMPLRTQLSPYYDQLALSVDSEWDDMLKTYHKHYAP